MGFLFKKKATDNIDPAKVHNQAIPNDDTLRYSGEMRAKSVTYDPHNIFTIAKSEDGNFEIFRQLFPNAHNFKVYFRNSSKNILIEKIFPHSEDQVLNISQNAFSDFGFAVTIDTYFKDGPRSVFDFFLYDNNGHELLHFYYERLGIKKFSFSESGQHFILLDHKGFYVYNMELRALTAFSPEDLENSDSSDFLIQENQKCIAYQYTQHPDKPFYHFTFDGRLIEEGAFKFQINKLDAINKQDTDFYALFDEIRAASRPLSEEDYRRFFEALNGYANKPDYDAAWLNREIGELELEVGKKESALKYFEKALELNPQIGVKRITAKLKKELG